MKTRNILSLLVFFFATAVFVACDNETGDTTKPGIQILSPVEDAEVIIGESITFKAVFTDNEALGSYKIDIHYPTDGHTHAARSDEHDPDKLPPFSYDKDWDLPAEISATVELDIDIPAGFRPGEYHFVVYCSDLAGNQATVAQDIILVEEE